MRNDRGRDDDDRNAAFRAAAWRHRGARDGFEVLFVRSSGDGYQCDGAVAAVEAGSAWSVRYSILLDRSWITRAAHVSGLSSAGDWELQLEADRRGNWRVDGETAAEPEGCLDLDLEASAFTNALPIQRLRLAVGESADAPAAYVRALEPRLERLEQRYKRLADEGDRSRYDYVALAFAFHATLVYDASGLILDYPGLAVRVA
jgi:uncharacterized protein